MIPAWKLQFVQIKKFFTTVCEIDVSQMSTWTHSLAKEQHVVEFRAWYSFISSYERCYMRSI